MSLFQNLRRRFTATPVMQDWPGLIEAYRSWLPVSDATPVISLREGATPLIPVPSVAEQIGKGVKVFVKYDGPEPHGVLQGPGHDHGHQQSQGSRL